MQDHLPPNKTGNERGMLDPSSTGYDRELGGETRMSAMAARATGVSFGSEPSAATGAMRQGGANDRREKMRIYREKHKEAKAVFERITGKSPETRMEAVELNARIQARGTALEKSLAQFAVADFCWACDEKDAEEELAELERY